MAVDVQPSTVSCLAPDTPNIHSGHTYTKPVTNECEQESQLCHHCFRILWKIYLFVCFIFSNVPLVLHSLGARKWKKKAFIYLVFHSFQTTNLYYFVTVIPWHVWSIALLFGPQSSHTPPSWLPPTSWNFGLWLVCETVHKPESPRDEIEKREVCTPQSSSRWSC